MGGRQFLRALDLVPLALLVISIAAAGAQGQIIPGSEDAKQARSAGPVIRLSLRQAVEHALSPEGNARVQLADELIHQAETRSAQARAALLPNLDGTVGQQSRTQNLSAVGVRFNFPLLGFSSPELVGPFNVFDARATVSQSIFDFSSIRRFQASRVGLSLAEAERERARDETAALTAEAYLSALRADANLEAARANVMLAQALYELAASQKDAGTGTGIELTRARVQLANERQRLLVAENARRRATLSLLKITGFPLDAIVEFTDALAYAPLEPMAIEQATAVALQSRTDWKAQQLRQDTARISYEATKMERLPSLVGFADYGSIGSSINNAIPTRTYGVSVRIPVFDGGRRDARRAEGLTLLNQERIKTGDLREQIQLEVRLALDALGSSDEQVKVSEEGIRLAEDELAQARRRYEAGVTSSIEVTDAQNRLARARDNRIIALFNYNMAQIELAQATGTIRQAIK